MSEIPVALSARMAEVRPFHVMALLGRARALEAQGRDIVHMEVGEPDFETPPAICQRGIAAIQAGHTRYTPAAGLPALRERIAGWYVERFGVSLDADRVLVTPGASGALSILTPALFGPGDEVLLPDPGYPCNRNFLLACGATPVSLPVGPESGWQPTAGQVAAAWSARTRGVMLASPANPTGAVLSAPESAALVECVHARGGVVIMDEIYQGLQYEGTPSSALQCDAQVFVVNSFSKFFGMTGWRVGWMVAPQWALEPLERMAQNLYLAAPTPAQHAALAAFEPATVELLEQRREVFRRRRDYLLEALSDLPLALEATPHGAFYVYLDVSAVTDDAMAFCTHLLEVHGVAVTPGVDFGAREADTHLRIAYTTDIERLREGVARIRTALADA